MQRNVVNILEHCLFQRISKSKRFWIDTNPKRMKLQVANQIYNFSKELLIEKSLFFKRLLEGKFKEATDEIVTIQYDPDMFQIMLRALTGQSVIKGDLKTQFRIIRTLDYFGIKEYESETIVLSIDVQPQEFFVFLEEIADFYSGEIPEPDWAKAASLLTDETDLSCLSKEILIELFLSSGFQPSNISRLTATLKRYDLTFLLDGQLPRLTLDPNAIGQATLLVKSEPYMNGFSSPFFKRILMENPVRLTLMDGSGKTWFGILDSNDPPKIDDIITKTILWIKPEIQYIGLR